MQSVNISEQAGMTLVELLITMALLSMLMITLMGSYDVAVRAWEKGRERSGRWESLLQLQRSLQRLFLRTVPVQYVIDDGDTKSRWFKGSPAEMQFMSGGAVYSRPGLVVPVKLTWVKKAEEYLLQYVQGKRFSDPWRGIEWDEKTLTVLLKSPRPAHFKYMAGVNLPPPGVSQGSLSASMQGVFRLAPETLDKYDATRQGKLPLSVQLIYGISQQEDFRLTFPCERESMATDLAVYMAMRKMRR